MAQKILVVDDKPFMIRLIQHHLEKAGYELIQARTSREAIEAVATEAPNLVLLNETQAQSDAGPALIELAQSDTQRIPVIRMSDIPAALRKDGTPSNIVFTHPFSPTKLLLEVKRLIPAAGAA